MKHSTSNLRVPSVASTTGSSPTHNAEVLAPLSSSMNDRVLVSESEADVKTVIEQNTVGQMGASSGGEESRENLGAKLRNTLSQEAVTSRYVSAGCGGFPPVLFLSAEWVHWSGSRRRRIVTPPTSGLQGAGAGAVPILELLISSCGVPQTLGSKPRLMDWSGYVYF